MTHFNGEVVIFEQNTCIDLIILKRKKNSLKIFSFDELADKTSV
jgi:hypothetical protein